MATRAASCFAVFRLACAHSAQQSKALSVYVFMHFLYLCQSRQMHTIRDWIASCEWPDLHGSPTTQQAIFANNGSQATAPASADNGGYVGCKTNGCSGDCHWHQSRACSAKSPERTSALPSRLLGEWHRLATTQRRRLGLGVGSPCASAWACRRPSDDPLEPADRPRRGRCPRRRSNRAGNVPRPARRCARCSAEGCALPTRKCRL